MILSAAVLLVLQLQQQQPVAGFIPGHNRFAHQQRKLSAALGMLDVDKADVSIPYDAAARLAYDQWRADFNKGDFDPDRFQTFKDNYEIVTIANVKAKKKARDDSTVSLSLMSLNEFGDMTQEEYEMLMGIAGAPQELQPPLPPAQEYEYDDAPSIEAPPPSPAQPTTTSDMYEMLMGIVGAPQEQQPPLVEAQPEQQPPLVEAQPEQKPSLVEVPPEQQSPLVEAPPEQQSPLVEAPPEQQPPLPSAQKYEYEYDAVPSIEAYEYEYDAVPSIGAPSPPAQPTTTSDMLLKAVEAVELQSEASNALEEAFDALAEEEQRLAEALGLESVDELEEALDALEGIAPDGGEIETGTLAREARIRDAYLNWCKAFDKEPDESRFPYFSQNFLFMEQYTKTTGKEMALNMYADFSKDEYEAATKKAAATAPMPPPKVDPPKATVPPPAAPKPPAPKEPETAPILTAEDVLGVAKGVTQGLGSVLGAATSFAKVAQSSIMKTIDEGMKDIEASSETPEDRQKKLDQLAAQQKEFEKATAAARAERVKIIQEKAKLEQEKREQIEKERADRLKLAEKESAKVQATVEAAAIASAKAERERQAKMAAQRASIDAQAAEQARQKAREFDQKQTIRLPPPPPKQATPRNMFTNFFSKGQPEAQKPPAPKRAPITKPSVKSVEMAPPPPIAKAAAPVVARSPTIPLYPPPAPKAKVEPVKKATPSPAPRPTISLFSPGPASAKPKAPSPAFSFFSPAPKTDVPKPVEKPVKVQTSPTLSLFRAPVKPKEKETSVKATAPEKPEAPAFSFFGSKPQAPKIPERSGTINIPKPKKEPVAKSSPSFSLFGKPAESKPAPTPAKSAPSPAPKSFGTISLFSSKASTAKKPPVEKAPAAEKKPAFSFFGGTKSSSTASSPPAAMAPPKNVPILSRWKQNPDGSITGKVLNSPNFKPGTEITTSPVKKGAKAGSLVKTGSGSQYYLA